MQMAGILTVAAAINMAGVLVSSVSFSLHFQSNNHSRLVTSSEQHDTVQWIPK